MNKYQEALEKLRVMERQSNFERCLDIAPQVNCDVLQELVNRAVPAKPQMKAMTGFRLYEAGVLVCPCCQEPITNAWTRAEYKPNYCHYCGQALDWSES